MKFEVGNRVTWSPTADAALIRFHGKGPFTVMKVVDIPPSMQQADRTQWVWIEDANKPVNCFANRDFMTWEGGQDAVHSPEQTTVERQELSPVQEAYIQAMAPEESRPSSPVEVGRPTADSGDSSVPTPPDEGDVGEASRAFQQELERQAKKG